MGSREGAEKARKRMQEKFGDRLDEVRKEWTSRGGKNAHNRHRITPEESQEMLKKRWNKEDA